ncbi:MAG TPA: PEP-CTERM sorting domain-containing protein [Bryobacteraceae bacterium]
MKFLRTVSLAAAALLGAGAARAEIIPIGSTLVFGGTNSPDTYSDTVTFGSTPVLVDSGKVQLFETQVATSGGGEWDVWHMSTVGGGPLAGNINAYWDIVMSYDLSEPVYFDQVANQFTVNGTPVSPISNFASICCATSSDPSPLTGDVWYNSGFKAPLPAGVQTNWRQIFISPYSFVSSGGVDPSTANGFNFALHFTPQSPVPEPAEFAPLLALGIGLVVLARKRKKMA